MKNLPANRTTIKDFVKKKISRGGFANLKIVDLAREELAKLKLEKLQQNPPKNIWEVFDRLNETYLPGKYTRPNHLKPYIDLLEKAQKENTYAVVHAPSQFGKSTACLVAIAYYCLVNKAKARSIIDSSGKKKYSDYFPDQHMYLCANANLARDKKNDFISILSALGAEYRTQGEMVFIKNLNNQRTEHSVKFGGILSSASGGNVNGIIAIDDYITKEDGCTPSAMEKIYKTFINNIISRQGPQYNRFSIIVIATRRNARDLSGRLIKDLGYQYIRLSALCDDPENDPIGRKIGESLWPEEKDVAFLENQKLLSGERTWELLYQGNDFLDDGSKLFQEPTYVKFIPDEPTEPYKYVYGVDFAYMEGTKNDWSCVVRLKVSMKTGIAWLDGVKIFRGQYEKALENFKPFIQLHPGPVKKIVGAYEGAFVPQTFSRFMGRELIIESTHSKQKRIRAINANLHTAWNEGWLLIPEDDKSEDMQQLILCVTNFIGDKTNNGYKDDPVDALVAAYDIIKDIRKRVLSGNALTHKRMSSMEVQRIKKQIADMGGRYYKPRE